MGIQEVLLLDSVVTTLAVQVPVFLVVCNLMVSQPVSKVDQEDSLADCLLGYQADCQVDILTSRLAFLV